MRVEGGQLGVRLEQMFAEERADMVGVYVIEDMIKTSTTLIR